MNTNWATGRNTKMCEEFDKGFSIEYNSSIKMWRVTHKFKIPRHLMGYTPHLEVLRKQLTKHVTRNRK